MKNKTLTTLLLNIILILLVVYGCSLDEASFTCEIKGTVYKSNGQPLEGAKVELKLAGSSFETETGSNGKYIIKNIEPGLAILYISKETYITQKNSLQLKGKETDIHDIILNSIAEKSYLTLDREHFTIQSKDTLAQMYINSNISFTLTCDADWITIPSNSFSGSNLVIFKTQKNDTPKEREAEIIVHGEYGLTAKFTLTQKAGPANRIIISD